MNSSASKPVSPLRELAKASWPGLPMVGAAFFCVAVAAWAIYGLSLIHI